MEQLCGIISMHTYLIDSLRLNDTSMTFSRQMLHQLITLIEQRLGLSATTLTRIGLSDLVASLAEDHTTYLQTLRQSDDYHPAWQRLIHALTIGETYFLRDKAHFRILRETILPRLIHERRQQGNLQLTIWCLACSTGEEAYSVATTLYETLPDLPQWNINLIATDINQRSIAIAKQGCYRDWSFRQTPDYFKQRYFTAVDDLWQIKPEIRQMVIFNQMNALSGIPKTQVDIIFARHMLMYLSADHAIQVEKIIYQALADGGWFIMGQAEALRSSHEQWILHMFPGLPIYQKIGAIQATTNPISYPTRPIGTPTFIETENNETSHYEKAVAAIHADNPHDAEHYLSLILSAQANHAKAHILLAAILANRQSYHEALIHIESALDVSGLLADAHYIKALIQIEQNQEDNAIQSLNAAIYCERNHALAGLLLGNLYQNQQDQTRANRHWRNALRAIEGMSDMSYISDVSDMTVARLCGMITKQQSLLDDAPKNPL